MNQAIEASPKGRTEMELMLSPLNLTSRPNFIPTRMYYLIQLTL